MTFESPLLLLTLVVPVAALVAYVRLQRRPPRYAVRFPNLDVLAGVVERRSAWRRHVPAALLLASLVALALAVARPALTSAFVEGEATVILTVDTSGSMRATDVKPSRIGAAQAAMLSFVDHLPHGVQIGVISFSSDPVVITPPTSDYDLVRQGIRLLEPGFRTAIGDALARSVDLAESVVGRSPDGPPPPGSKAPAAIVLLSDGAQTSGVLSPDEGAARAKQAGIPVFTIALGTPNGTLDPRTFGGGGGGFGNGGFGFGRRIPVPPDPVTLARIASETGGLAFTARDAGRLSSIYRKLSASVARVERRREVTVALVGAGAVLLLAAGALAGARLPRLP